MFDSAPWKYPKVISKWYLGNTLNKSVINDVVDFRWSQFCSYCLPMFICSPPLSLIVLEFRKTKKTLVPYPLARGVLTLSLTEVFHPKLWINRWTVRGVFDGDLSQAPSFSAEGHRGRGYDQITYWIAQEVLTLSSKSKRFAWSFEKNTHFRRCFWQLLFKSVELF